MVEKKPVSNDVCNLMISHVYCTSVFQCVSEKAAVAIKAQIKLSASRSCAGFFFFFLSQKDFFCSLNKSTGAGK